MSPSSMSTMTAPAHGADSAPTPSVAPAAWAHSMDAGAPIKLLLSYEHKVSIIVVSFNTRELLRHCLQSVLAECARLPAASSAEILVVDNASSDGSPEMVEREMMDREFPAAASPDRSAPGSRVPVRLIRSAVNLGFAGANNLAMSQARGRYLVLLNSDALFHTGALRLAIQHMDQNTQAGVGGARLVGPQGEWQPSARSFPTLWHVFVVFSGLATRFPKSRLFGAFDRTWASANLAAEVDWVPGAFSIMRREALARTGLFDPRFFLYCEEVDLCRRMKAQGFKVLYWPDVVVTHIGGESSRQLSTLEFSDSDSQVILWRMRATLLYFRKHQGIRVWGIRLLEDGMQCMRWLRNRWSRNPGRRVRAEEARICLALMHQAWRDTSGGRVSPPQPW